MGVDNETVGANLMLEELERKKVVLLRLAESLKTKDFDFYMKDQVGTGRMPTLKALAREWKNRGSRWVDPETKAARFTGQSLLEALDEGILVAVPVDKFDNGAEGILIPDKVAEVIRGYCDLVETCAKAEVAGVHVGEYLAVVVSVAGKLQLEPPLELDLRESYEGSLTSGRLNG